MNYRKLGKTNFEVSGIGYGAWGIGAAHWIGADDADSLAALREAGFTRVSFGMQSAVPHVLATLERTHDPERIPLVVEWARAAGLQVSLDLIYGTPGESVDDWRASLVPVSTINA